MTVVEYVRKMRSLGEMTAAGRTLEDDELVEYILTGLDEEYDSLVSAVLARSDPIPISELYSQILAYLTRVDLCNKGNNSGSSANTASRGRERGGPGRFGQGNRGGRSFNFHASRGSRGGFNPWQARSGPRNGGSSGDRPICQVCNKVGHTADRCWYRYDENYVLDPRHAVVATNSYMVDTNWYTDMGATDHITGELEKLSLQEMYHSGEQIQATNGVGMSISHVGETTFHTQDRDLKFKHILHVPQVKKNLVSVHHFTSDNNIFLEYHPYFFLIKDRATRKLLLKERCHKGLYPLPTSITREVLGGTRPSLH
jgi:hypothetical protein